MIDGLETRLANTLRWSIQFCSVFALKSLNRQVQTWNRHLGYFGGEIVGGNSLLESITPPLPPQPTPHPIPHPTPTDSPHAFDCCSANWKKVFGFTREQSTKDDTVSLLDLLLLLEEANIKITLNNYLCPFSCGLSLEVNSSNHTGASFSTFHR